MKNNNEEIFSAAHFLPAVEQPGKILSPFHAIDSCRRNEISVVDFQHDLKKMCSVLQTSTIGKF